MVPGSSRNPYGVTSNGADPSTVPFDLISRAALLVERPTRPARLLELFDEVLLTAEVIEKGPERDRKVA